MFDAVEDGRVDGLSAEEEVEEAEPADARPREDVPDLVALWGAAGRGLLGAEVFLSGEGRLGKLH